MKTFWRKAPLIAAGLVATALLVVMAGRVLTAVRPSHTGLSPAPGRVSAAEVATLQSAEYQDASSMDVDAIKDMLRTALLHQNNIVQGTNPEQEPLDATRLTSFVHEASDRLAMYMRPSFEQYKEYVASHTGKPVGDEKQEAWELAARPFKEARYDVGHAEVRPVYIRGTERWRAGEFGGHMTYRKDSGLYSSKSTNPTKPGSPSDVYAVFIPMQIEVLDRNSGSPRVASEKSNTYFVLQFIWEDSRSRWVPWRTGVYDPSASADILPGPWL